VSCHVHELQYTWGAKVIGHRRVSDKAPIRQRLAVMGFVVHAGR
jgi:hypothetical protein